MRDEDEIEERRIAAMMPPYMCPICGREMGAIIGSAKWPGCQPDACVNWKPAAVGDRFRFEYPDESKFNRTLLVVDVRGVGTDDLVFFDDTTHAKQKHLVRVPKIERLPYSSTDGFDCRSGNCPACTPERKDDHGISGGTAQFAVRTTIADGRRAVIVLRILLSRWPASVDIDRLYREMPKMRRPRGERIEFHLEATEADRIYYKMNAATAGELAVTPCDLMGEGGLCDDAPARGEVSFLQSNRYDQLGSDTGGAEQSEAFWNWLEERLLDWCRTVKPAS